MNQREINAAKRYIEIYNLSPPVDIVKEIERFATIESISDFPVPDIDAILLKPNQSSNYTLLLNQSQSNNRQRFTLAHELGHIVMPWHFGTFACVTAIGNSYVTSNLTSEQIEAEANRFAGEILIPTEWCKNEASRLKNKINEIFVSIQRCCQVSPEAAFFGLSRALPAYYLLALSESESKRVIYLTKSVDTKVDFPIIKTEEDRHGRKIHNRNLTISELDIHVKDHTSKGSYIDGARYELRWWAFDYSSDFNSSFNKTHSKILLKKIIDDVYSNESLPKQKSLLQSVNGVAATVNSRGNHKNPAELYSSMKQNFQGRMELQAACSHKDFQDYLKNKATELFANRKADKKKLGAK